MIVAVGAAQLTGLNQPTGAKWLAAPSSGSSSSWSSRLVALRCLATRTQPVGDALIRLAGRPVVDQRRRMSSCPMGTIGGVPRP